MSNFPVNAPPSLLIDAGVATITLQRPGLRNSLNNQDLSTLLDHFAAINANLTIRVVVLRAHTQDMPRPVFSAGYHVAGLDDDTSAPNFFQTVPDALARLRPVTICALNGSVYGGATDVVLACDLVLAQQGMEWRMPACAIGLHYYASGLQRYVQKMGLSLSQRTFLLGLAMPFEQLQACGVFHALVSESQFDEHLHQLEQQVLNMAPLAVQATKQSLMDVALNTVDLDTLAAREAMSQSSADFAEGRLAMQERRRPQFQGR
jgi:enoyl-CoA hydratase/carnithine racemase